jgi:2-dehydropantoate 2-reductase
MSEEALQFAVIGAGSLGCVYGGNLARIGQRVAFVDIWREHVDQIRSQGLQMEGLTGNFTVACHAVTDAHKAPKADVALICVNAYSTEQAAHAARALLQSEGYCLTLQNGAGNVEKLTAALGTGRVLAGLSFQSGDLVGPGYARHTNNGPTYMGELDRSQTPRLKRLAELFAEGGLNPVLVPDVVSTIWEKFIHNCGINAIAALTNLRPGHFQEVPALGEFQTEIINETVAMLRAKGVSIPDRDYVGDIREYCAHKFHRVSMMQHLLRGQRTEIDALNGYVASESRRLGLTAPYNTALTQLIRGREYKPAGDPDQRHAAEQAAGRGVK